jgi:LysM repeat protein
MMRSLTLNLYRTFISSTAVALVIVGIAASSYSAATAQSGNLLVNPGMENPYLGQGAPDQTAPTGWSLWSTGYPVTSFPHIDPYQIHGGAAAWNIRKGFAPFTAGGYQQVSGIAIGSTIHASVWGQNYTCNDQTYSCIGSDGKHHSDTSSGAVIRVGIDPSGGTNPNSGQIVWSATNGAFDAWTQVSTDAVNCNATVTIFLYATQQTGMFINAVYFDDASLTVTTPGTGTTATCGAAPASAGGASSSGASPVPTVAKYAPFVQKQDGLQPDGSVIHTVQPGDTLAGIAYAYKISVDTLRELNNIQPGDNFLKIGQKIIVRGPTPMTPTKVPTPAFSPTSGAVPIIVVTRTLIPIPPTPVIVTPRPTPQIEVF